MATATKPHEQPAPIGQRALTINPALKPLEFLIGQWRTTGRHPAFPDVELNGRTSFDWHQGGAFLITHNEVDHPDFPDGVAIIGPDDRAGTMTMIYFDERGVSRTMAVEPGDNRLTWTHPDPKFRQSLTIVADQGGERLKSTGRMAKDGGEWEDDLSQEFVREESRR